MSIKPPNSLFLLEQRDKACKQDILEVQLLPRAWQPQIMGACVFPITLATPVPLLQQACLCTSGLPLLYILLQLFNLSFHFPSSMSPSLSPNFIISAVWNSLIFLTVCTPICNFSLKKKTLSLGQQLLENTCKGSPCVPRHLVQHQIIV